MIPIQIYIPIVATLIIIILRILFFKKPKTYHNLYLKRYQIQVYDADGDMLFFEIFEGFNFEEACQNAKQKFYARFPNGKKQDKDNTPIQYPVRFFHQI